MSYLLEIEGVGFSYGGRSVLHSATFRAGEGEFLALLGMNGAGKSTLLDIVSGFRRPETGSVAIAGRNQRLWTRARDVATGESSAAVHSRRSTFHGRATGGDGKVSAYRSLV